MKRTSVRQLSFFADENVSIRLVNVLRELDRDNRFCALEEKFDKGTKDEEWLNAIGAWKPKPIVICGDGRILRNDAQLAALQGARMHFVYLSGGFTGLNLIKQVIAILRRWEELCAQLRKTNQPSVFEMQPKAGAKIVRILADYRSRKQTRRRP